MDTQRSHRYPERERKLYGSLAEGLIRKLADATVKAAVSWSVNHYSSTVTDSSRSSQIRFRSGLSIKYKSSGSWIPF
jgi:hypothetical protein